MTEVRTSKDVYKSTPAIAGNNIGEIDRHIERARLAAALPIVMGLRGLSQADAYAWLEYRREIVIPDNEKQLMKAVERQLNTIKWVLVWTMIIIPILAGIAVAVTVGVLAANSPSYDY